MTKGDKNAYKEMRNDYKEKKTTTKEQKGDSNVSKQLINPIINVLFLIRKPIYSVFDNCIYILY